MMSPQEMAELRASAGLTQEELAKRLGCSRRTVLRLENGEAPITEAVEATMRRLRDPVEPEIVTSEPVVSPSPGDWRELTREERQMLPPGSPGWIYRPWDVLPKGQWIEVLDTPTVFANGAICTRIRWGSNGAGPPVMNLIGTTKDATPVERDGFDSLAPEAYRAMTPNKGDPAFLGKDKKK